MKKDPWNRGTVSVGLAFSIALLSGCAGQTTPPIECQDRCYPEGLRECYLDGVRTCGQYNVDACLEWSHKSACPAHHSCQDGECLADFECLAEGECAPGDSEIETCQTTGWRSRDCGQECMWEEWSDCHLNTVCMPSQTETASCEGDGTAERICNTDGYWGAWGACTHETVCQPGELEQSECEDDGLMQRQCDENGLWGAWGACSHTGTCTPGQREFVPCGNCGESERICGADGEWGLFSACTGEGVCSPQQMDTIGCGDCGTKMRTCGLDCTWGEFGDCYDEGVCTPGDQQSCAGICAGTKTCNDSCRFAPCLPTPPGTACDDGNACTANDACDGEGACAGVLPQEICNAIDDDCDGLIDQAGCLATVYRFVHGTNGDHMYKPDDPTPESGYALESFARFQVYRTQVPGTTALVQVRKSTDHMLTYDPNEGASAGYSLDRIIGYVIKDAGAGWPVNDRTTTRVCRYFQPTTGDHMVFTNTDAMEQFGYQLEACFATIWDWTFDYFIGPICQPEADPACDSGGHYLPVTHWQGGHFQYLGGEQPEYSAGNPITDPGSYVMGNCYRLYSLLMPDFETYIGDKYSITAIDSQAALNWVVPPCEHSGIRVKLLPPQPAEAGFPDLGHPLSGTCQVQVIQDTIIDGSLVAVLLPPNWTAEAPDGWYPIVINSFYDLNQNLFQVHGSFLAEIVAKSGIGGRRGVIGVLSNGGGAVISRGFDERMYAQTAATIDWVAEQFHGNRDEVITFGGSRGGFTALAIASNPAGYDYRTRLVIAGASPTKLGSHVTLTSPTYTGLFEVASGTIGLADAWRTGWTYPACAGKPHLQGMTATEATLQILTGTSSSSLADSQHSLASTDFINGLVAAGTQVYLEITGHDFICPYHLQYEYARELQAAGVPLQSVVLLKSGHGMLNSGSNPDYPEDWQQLLFEAVMRVSAPGHLPTDDFPGVIAEDAWEFWRVNPASNQVESLQPTGGHPFTLEGPYKVAPGQTWPVVMAGEPGTEYEVAITDQGATAWSTSGTLPADGTQVVWNNSPPGPAGREYLYNLRIRKPGATWKTIPNTQTPTGDPARMYVMTAEPVTGGTGAHLAFSPPRLAGRATNWGLSEY